MIDYSNYVMLISGVIIGGWNIYLYSKIRNNHIRVNDFVTNFPTPEELAKEILKVKMPIEELPDDVKNKIKGMMNTSEDNNTNSDVLTKSNIPSYMG